MEVLKNKYNINDVVLVSGYSVGFRVVAIELDDLYGVIYYNLLDSRENCFTGISQEQIIGRKDELCKE